MSNFIIGDTLTYKKGKGGNTIKITGVTRYNYMVLYNDKLEPISVGIEFVNKHYKLKLVSILINL